MKNVFKRNQIVITALAIMIAAAFYLNYAGKIDMSQESYQAGITESENENEITADISDEDTYLADADSYSQVSSQYLASEEQILQDIAPSKEGDILSNDADAYVYEDETEKSDEFAENISETDADITQDVPGEAVLTSAVASNGFISQAKLSREQVRSKNKEMLMEIINNTEITEEQKQSAIDSMVSLTKISEKETATEILLESKGFENVVVSITDDTADVVVGINELSDAKRAQIEDIMKRKTGVSPENIVITPVALKDN